jgi:ATP-dependent Clp protease adapter protein ClpS
MSKIVAEPELDQDLISELEDVFADLYTVLIYNDDVNTISHVVSVFMKCFSIPYSEAFLLAATIDSEGKYVYGVFSKEDAVNKANYCCQHQIQATIAPL